MSTGHPQDQQRSDGSTCPSRSPESNRPCGLPDDPLFHEAGHLSPLYGVSRSAWPTSDADHERWGDSSVSGMGATQ